MSEPIIYHVKPEQVGREDVGDYLRKAIAKQFENKEYYVAKEVVEERVTKYSNGKPRKLRGFVINEGNSLGHVIYFDVTECVGGADWLSIR
jgi:hypothetical protein